MFSLVVAITSSYTRREAEFQMLNLKNYIIHVGGSWMLFFRLKVNKTDGDTFITLLTKGVMFLLL